MISSILSSEEDITEMRGLINRLGTRSGVVDFEEQIQLKSVKSTTRLWHDDGALVGFCYVDDYCNMWFDAAPECGGLGEVEDQMIAWGEVCQMNRNTDSGKDDTLDSTSRAEDLHRIHVLEKHGFQQEAVRTLHYSRLLSDPIDQFPLPRGFSIRAVRGLEEVGALVALHRAAFGTDNMTVELRTAMMKSPLYVPEMDLVAVAPDGSLAAFCVCGFEDAKRRIGYTDPIGTHPAYQRQGLGLAIITYGLKLLRDSGSEVVHLGTSSENTGMQRLAEKSGFTIEREQLWFSKNLTRSLPF